MKTPIPPALGGQSAQAAFGLGKPRTGNRRSWTGMILRGSVRAPLAGLFAGSRLLEAVIALILGRLVKPVAAVVAFLAVFGAATVAVVNVGTKVTRGALRYAAVASDSAYRKVGESRVFVASLLPRFAEEDAAPRAELVAYGYTPGAESATPAFGAAPAYPTDAEAARSREDGSQPDTASVKTHGFLDAIEDAAKSVVGLLPGIGAEPDEYPAPPGLPRIEGKILEKAGGHRIQTLITYVLNSMHHVEADGQLELVGDHGLAFGPLQVRREPCEDLKKFFGAEVKPEACNGDWVLSEYVVRLYAGYWARHIEQQSGERIRAEDILRIWNGGPDMGPFSKTDQYVAKAVRFDPKIAKIVATKK